MTRRIPRGLALSSAISTRRIPVSGATITRTAW